MADSLIELKAGNDAKASELNSNFKLLKNLIDSNFSTLSNNIGTVSSGYQSADKNNKNAIYSILSSLVTREFSVLDVKVATKNEVKEDYEYSFSGYITSDNNFLYARVDKNDATWELVPANNVKYYVKKVYKYKSTVTNPALSSVTLGINIENDVNGFPIVETVEDAGSGLAKVTRYEPYVARKEQGGLIHLLIESNAKRNVTFTFPESFEKEYNFKFNAIADSNIYNGTYFGGGTSDYVVSGNKRFYNSWKEAITNTYATNPTETTIQISFNDTGDYGRAYHFHWKAEQFNEEL